jgi:RNA polymerase sigma factor (sigma-70 family)
MPPENTEQARWFADVVQPHEAELRSWLLNRFPSECDIDDIMQETYVRMLRARDRGEFRSAKAYLFATARNLALDYLRHRNVLHAESLVESEALSVLEEGEGIPETIARNQELAILTEAIQSLPDRCRQVFTLRKVYGLSQKEIAVRLAISEHTVSAQLTIGFHKCATYFAQRSSGKGEQ